MPDFLNILKNETGGLPNWAWIAVVAVGGGLGFWLLRSTGSNNDTSGSDLTSTIENPPATQLIPVPGPAGPQGPSGVAPDQLQSIIDTANRAFSGSFGVQIGYTVDSKGNVTGIKLYKNPTTGEPYDLSVPIGGNPYQGGNGPTTSPNYTIKAGDFLAKIGQAFGIAWQNIYAANQQVIETAALAHGYSSSQGGRFIFPGTEIVIPTGSNPTPGQT
jgi:hypothetical protein